MPAVKMSYSKFRDMLPRKRSGKGLFLLSSEGGIPAKKLASLQTRYSGKIVRFLEGEVHD